MFGMQLSAWQNTTKKNQNRKTYLNEINKGDKMKRLNLKELKDLLNKLPEKNLEKYSICHGLALEDPDPELRLIWIGDEEEGENLSKLYDTEEYEQIKEGLIDFLNKDLKKIAICLIDEDKMEDSDDYVDDLDW